MLPNLVPSNRRTLSHSYNNNTKNKQPASSRKVLIVLAIAVPSFFLGNLFSLYNGVVQCASEHHLEGSASAVLNPTGMRNTKADATVMLQQTPQQKEQERIKVEADVQARVAEKVRTLTIEMQAHAAESVDRLVEERMQVFQQQLDVNCASPGDKESTTAKESTKTSVLFPVNQVGHYAMGMARTTKDAFTGKLDMGVPLDKPVNGSLDVLMIYGNAKSLPQKTRNAGSDVVLDLSVEEALEHCDYLNIMLTWHTAGGREQCIAIVPQYESYHLQKWMRVDGAGRLDKSTPLRMVSRGHQSNGRDQFSPPTMTDTRKNWDLLKGYLESIDDVMADLKPIVEKIAVKNTIIVMVCNFGQAELLMNFVCSAKARGFDISNILVFSTDQETTDLAESIGLTAYFDERNFGDIPLEAAGRYGDRKFVAMMMAKVICVQVVSMLGYDFLFQDVDIVWYSNPLDYFHNPHSSISEYDVFFQDDGGHSVRYAPYSANSGFYYVKYNSRTRHFLTSLLMAGDLVLKTNSHQQALIALLNEHVSLYGLKAKVLSRDLEEFPGGYQFNQKSGDYMRALFNKTIHPIIFHMSWTENKNNKLLYFKQMGEWYTQDVCVGKKVPELTGGNNDTVVTTKCCSAEPLVSCHYSDKPSVIPCRESPAIDKGKRKSFW